jgi:hypothetical protein
MVASCCRRIRVQRRWQPNLPHELTYLVVEPAAA